MDGCQKDPLDLNKTKLRRNPDKPVLELPMGIVFNEVVAVDVGELKGKQFLVIVDLATHYCWGSWISNKTPMEIINMFIERWLGVFGTPKMILSDNGLEFQNDGET